MLVSPGLVGRIGKGSGSLAAPSLNFDAASGVLPSGFTTTRATTAWYFDSTGTLQQAAVDVPRFEYDPATLALKGLFIEEQRTNSIRNPRAEGATSGTPGTPPTNWSISAPAGGGTLTTSVVSASTESGVPFGEFRVNGTSGTGAFALIEFEVPFTTVASAAQVWAASFFARLSAGSWTNISGAPRLEIIFYDAGTGTLQGTSTTYTPTSAGLATQRVTFTATAPALTATVRCRFGVNFVDASAIDFTIRLGAPQLELGAFATSVILPPAAAPATSTRNHDLVLATSIPWFNPTQGTILWQGSTTEVFPSGSRRAYEFGDNTSQNIIYASAPNATAGRFGVNTAGVAEASIDVARGSGIPFRICGAYATNDVAAAVNGTLGTPDTAVTLPAVTRLRLGGRNEIEAASTTLNGCIRSFVYYPTRLSNAQLQALSYPTPTLNWDASTLALPAGFTTTRATNAWYFNSAGTLTQASSNTPRFDYDPATLLLKGLLIEDARTNSQTNPRMEGAASGTPGTSPTGWSGGGFFNQQIIGVGVENGIPYIDYRSSGTSVGSSTYWWLIPVPLSQNVAAAVSQLWTGSTYMRLIAGAWPGGNVPRVQVEFFDAADASTTGTNTSVNITPTGAALNTQRFSCTATATGATTAKVRMSIACNIPADTPVDMTFRIGAPQLELGAFASSVIMPPAGSPGASTRNADTIKSTSIPWLNASEGTFLWTGAPVNFPSTVDTLNRPFGLSKASAPTQEQFIAYLTGVGGSAGFHWQAVSGGSNLYDISATTSAATWATQQKVACVYKTASHAVRRGATAASSAAAGVPTGVDQIFFGQGPNGGAQALAGHILNFTYYPLRLTDAQLQALTT